MDVEKVPELEIPDKLSTRDGLSLTGKFATNSIISLSAFRNIKITRNTEDVPSPHANKEDVKVFHLQQHFIFEDFILRTLIGEANGIFMTVQDLQKKGSKQEYVKLSRTYRSIIRACLEKLQEAVSTSEEYQSFITILYTIECIWHLSEILFIDPTPSNIVTPQLLEWTRFHFPSAERNATDLLLHGRDADESEQYWPSVKGLILQGQIDVARAILQLHSMSESNAFRMADQILKSMPVSNIYGGASIQKFRSQWQYWLTDTERKLSTGIFATEPDLEEIIYIIIGNTQTWNKYIKKSQNWYELFPGFLFFTDPACKSFELGTLAQCWINRWANLKDFTHSNFMKHLDKVILYLLESDIHKVLHSIQQIGDNQWFVTHLTDLLYNCGQLELIGENKLTDCEDFRQSLLFDFGSTLMSKDSIWLFGVNYLDQCGLEGEGAIKILLPRIPVKNEIQALKVIDVAQSRGYTEVVQEICKIFAKKSMSLNRPGSALDWAIRSKDTTYVTSITDFFLTHYSKTGEMLCEDVLSNIGAKMFISPRLVFLVKYFDFYQFYRKKDFPAAAELLINLLDSKITPEFFWPSLLVDTIPLLESNIPQIPSKETAIILHHVESDLMPLIEKKKSKVRENPEMPVEIIKDYRVESIDEIVKLLRLACARNISRAFIIENTQKNLVAF